MHLGSLFTALASYLQAKARRGIWQVRIDDLDPLRSSREAATQILRTLKAFGLEWDGPVLYQSQRHAHYQRALARLKRKRLIYACGCSRKTLAERNRQGQNPAIYPGLCRNKNIDASQQPHALRIKTPDRIIAFQDQLQGHFQQNLASEVGDFILRRRDQAYAYQLAVVVDDEAQGINEIVRGIDLLDNTPRQIYLQQCLSLPIPKYLHLPVLVDESGAKLSKQSGASAVDSRNPTRILFQLLRLLNHPPPDNFLQQSPPTLLNWASANWDCAKLPRQHTIPLWEFIRYT